MGIKKNFGYNLILTFCNYLFPLMVYPYISRVLEVDNIGKCNFIDGIINYFVLFSLAGISSYGVREIARYRDNQKKLNSIFSSLVFFNFILTIVSIIVLVVCMYTIPIFQEYHKFLWLGIIKIFFSVFIVEWFIQGLELFRYITIRTVVIRLFFVISVFVFVHKKSDVLTYFGLLSCVTVANSIINWKYVSRYVKFEVKLLSIKKIIKPVFSFGYYRLLTSMYTSFNIVFLGFITTDTQVGYFSTATKLNSIIMSVFTAFTTVMIPRVADILNKQDLQRLQSISDQVFRMLLIISIPISIFCFVFANQIITIIAGQGYQGAVIPFKIIIGLIIIIGLEQILVQQFLMASPKSNKYIMVLSTTGAIIGLTLNILLTPKYYSIGTSISWVCSEISILILSLIFVKRLFNLDYKIKEYLDIIFWSLFYALDFLVIDHCINNLWVTLTIGALSGIFLFLLINLFIISPHKFPLDLRHYPTIYYLLKKINHHY